MHVEIMIGDNQDIENGVKYSIINPDGEVQDSGLLLNEEIKRFTYTENRGTWKLKIDLEENQEVFIDRRVKINSEEK